MILTLKPNAPVSMFLSDNSAKASIIRNSTQQTPGQLEFELWDMSADTAPPLKSSGELQVENISPIPNIIFSDDLSVVLIGDWLYRVDLDSKPLSITSIYTRPLEDQRPETVLWLFRHKDLLFLARVESLHIVLREKDKPIEVQEPEEALGTTKTHTDCDSCLQSCPSSRFYTCEICQVFGLEFKICRDCLQGFWCRCKMHVLSSKAANDTSKTKPLSWKNTPCPSWTSATQCSR
ncbi:hypothetical protein LZ31DRAFT_272679 [Colletotrichum somersetense]|nr:hypothetical protein LZ31DRAFT_272679 [Colletotrichum somersetense]